MKIAAEQAEVAKRAKAEVAEAERVKIIDEKAAVDEKA